jgi:hypothetical protein
MKPNHKCSGNPKSEKAKTMESLIEKDFKK